MSPFIPGRYGGDGHSDWLGNISRLTGETGTLAHGLAFDFPLWHPPDEKPDEILSKGDDIPLFKSQDGKIRVISSGVGQEHRVIAASVIFGALCRKDERTLTDQLLARYLTFLL